MQATPASRPLPPAARRPWRGLPQARLPDVGAGVPGPTPVLGRPRLARNARFLLHVVEGTGETGVVFCDLPSVPPSPMGKFLLTQMAAVAELEAGLI